MKTFHYIALALTALLLVTSCAIDEMWSDVEPADEQKVLTFKPKFEDFETVTKAIGDGSKVDKLLVQVYEENGETPVFSEDYSRDGWNKVQIAFYYGKTYKVYFWAYDSNAPFTAYKYTIINGEIQLNKPIEINYHQNDLAYNTLESLDAFYSVQTVNLSASDKKENTVKLTRPFAQVNLGALAEDFYDAQVSEAVFKVKDIPSVFTLSDSGVNADDNSETITSPSFSFTHFNLDDESKITFENKDYRYIGTTYILVPSLTDKVTVDVAIYGQDPNSPMKEATVELTVGSNKRTNLIFKEIAPSWNDSLADSSEDVPSTETEDGWIHITKPEELAALLIYGGTEGKKYHICANLDMSGMPQTTASQIGLAESGYRKLTIDAGKYNGDKVTGSYMLKNINGLKAFFGIASDLHIQNIILDNVNVSGDTHVGVLVNSLSGQNTFTNVTIQNSSATTASGAAGGMIGYAGRSSEKDRSETLSVIIDNCKINSTTVAGKQAQGKFVGLFSGYDSGETLTVASDCEANTTFTNYSSSPYKSENQSCFLDAPDSKFDEYLGTEKYRRGVINYGDQRIVPKWDGTTSVKPFFEDSKEMVAQIYSPFDLAYLQGKTLTTLRFKSDVDLAGVCDDCRDGNGNSTKANDDLSTCIHCKPFEAIVSLNNLYGENHILYNLFVQGIHECSGNAEDGRSFIRHTEAGNFENFTFDGAVIKCIDDIAYRNNVTLGGNAYAGTLTSRVNGKMTITNVHSRNGHVIGISKFGGLIGTVNGGINATNCSVENYIIENHRINVTNSYSVTVEKNFAGIPAKAECSENFYTEGESGGFIGFIKSNSTITNCHTRHITMKCYGQDDRNTKIACYTWGKEFVFWGKEQWNKVMDMPYTIAGRHNNAFIGDIRTPSSNVITITDCTTSNNTYVEGYDADYYGVNGYSPVNNNEIVGCVYFVGKDMEILGKTLHAGDYKGTVTINGESMSFIGG